LTKELTASKQLNSNKDNEILDKNNKINELDQRIIKINKTIENKLDSIKEFEKVILSNKSVINQLEIQIRNLKDNEC